MAQKTPPSNVVPFRPPDPPGGGRSFRLPKWVPRELFTTATGWIVVLNLAVWIAMIVASRGAGLFSRFPPDVTWAFGSLVPELVPSEPWRVLSSTFIHADLSHIAMNMAILWFTGRQLERAFGPARFLALYFAASLTGSAFSIGYHLLVSEGTSVGASGGVLGVVAALAAFFWRATGRRSEPTKQWLWFCALGLIGGVVTSIFGMPVDNAAHLGGMLGGFALSWVAFAGRPSWPAAISRAVIGGVLFLSAASVAVSLAIGDKIGAVTPVDTTPRAQREGAEALDRGDFVTAEKKLAEAIEAAPGDSFLRTLHSTALGNMGREDEAEKELNMAETLLAEQRVREPDNAFAAFSHWNVLRLLARNGEAAEALRAAAAGDGTSATLTAVAEQLEAMGDLELARKTAVRAILKDPQAAAPREILTRVKKEIADQPPQP